MSHIPSEYQNLFKEIDPDIREVLNAVDFTKLSANNQGLSSYSEDPFRILIETERPRYVIASEYLKSAVPSGKIVDLGTFVPYFPIMLRKMGYEVTICEKYSLYSKEFKTAIYKLADKYGIEVKDTDILNDDLTALKDADAALLMAVVEHLNGSPKQLMETIYKNLPDHKHLLFEIPNIADLSKRLRLLKGKSPLPDYKGYFNSSYPFMGHNREMTADEVSFMLPACGFDVKRIGTFDYNFANNQNRKDKVIKILKKILPFKNQGETIFALGQKK
jgi:hypothetical protein